MEDLPEYGEIGAYYKSWGDPDKPGTYYRSIPSRPCTARELNLETNSTDDVVKFWPFDSKSSIYDITMFAKNFRCID